MPQALDITGQRYGRLVALKRVPNSLSGKQLKVTWLFRCDCGTEVVRKLMNIRRTDTKSCGCQKHEASIKAGERSRLALGESSFRGLYYAYRARANKLGLPFELSTEDFRALTQQHCSYCGAWPSQLHRANVSSHGKYRYNGIDRIDNAFGYVKTNVVTCCRVCNFAKGTRSRQEFLAWVELVASRIVRNGRNTGLSELSATG